MSLKWEGFRLSLYEAWIEIILHTIACIAMLAVISVYILIVHCNDKRVLIINRKNRGLTFSKTNSNSTAVTATNTNIPDNVKDNTYKSSKVKINKGFHGFLIASLILSFVYIYLCYLTNVVFSIILGFRWNNGCFIRSAYQLIFVLQRIIAYSFYILRLNVTFKGSVFEVSKKNIRIMMILLIVVLGSSAFPSTIAGYFINNFQCSGEYYKYYIYGAIWFNFVDISWCIILSIIYIKKLRQLLKNVHAKNDKIRFIVNKLSVLAFVTVLSTLMTSIAIFGTIIWLYVFMSIDLIANNICIMLSFPIFDKSYQYYCCCCIKIQNYCCIRPNEPEMELQKDIEWNKSAIKSTSNEPKITIQYGE